MALINVTPVMTSDTAPSPYVASCSSVYSVTYSAWKAFNNNIQVNDSMEGWACASPVSLPSKSSIGEYIQMNFGTLTPLTNVHIGTYYPSIPLRMDKVDILVSIDGVTFTKIVDSYTLKYTINSGAMAEVVLDKLYIIKYIRIVNKSCARPDMQVGSTEIRFYYDDEKLNQDDGNKDVTTTYSSLLYTLPMNTTEQIIARELDHREGLLGMANDSENYGDLYVVGKDGKSHLTKSGMKSEVIFDGVANAVGTYGLSKNIMNYKYLIVYADTTSGNETDVACSSTIVCCNDINMSKKWRYSITNASELTDQFVSYCINFSFTNDKDKLSVDQILETSIYRSDSSIKKIIGIY